MLRSFSFMEEVDSRTWSLFDADIEKTDCTMEIIDAVKSGRLNLDKIEDNSFSLVAYDTAVRRNKKMSAGAKAYRELHVCEVDDDACVEAFGVTEAVLAEYANQLDAYAELDDRSELREAIDGLCAMHKDILIVYRVELWTCIRQALKGVHISIKILQELVAEVPHFGDLLQVVLSSGEGVANLLPQIAA